MNFLYFLPSIICFLIAAIMLYKNREGWGWFLFVGFLIIPVISHPDKPFASLEITSKTEQSQ